MRIDSNDRFLTNQFYVRTALGAGLSVLGIFQIMTRIGWRILKNMPSARINSSPRDSVFFRVAIRILGPIVNPNGFAEIKKIYTQKGVAGLGRLQSAHLHSTDLPHSTPLKAVQINQPI